MTTVLLTGLLVPAAMSLALTAAAIPLLRRAHIVDVPVRRSLHQSPVPRGGGVAVVLAVSLSIWAAPLTATYQEALLHTAPRVDVVITGLGTILAFALVGLVEDLFSLSAGSRLILQLVLGLGLGLAACRAFGTPLWLAPVVSLGTSALVNATNFMDGANGLAGGHAVVAALWYALVAMVTPVAGLGPVMTAVAGACLGFLPFNAPRARVFLGDSGSYALGGAWAFAVTTCLAQAVAVDVAVAPLLVLLADTGYTLWMRIRSGQRWHEPHKLHVYQRLVSAGWPHWGSALLVALTAIACSALAAADLISSHPAWATPVAMAAVLALYLQMPSIIGAPSPFSMLRRTR